ncbi:ABC transporter substrate-binding protein [Colwellia psychrerythraea]|uniref:ABC transporter substrate-binding protein n=1 Tax=Colwellia psychrerythraea TaxID=28229 RepID=UPI000A9B28D2|nr:ABC transporter substrate-binding protein [Colwellia psychrerythraea]
MVFLNPGFPEENATGSFWANVTLFMEAAAADLDIELVTVYAYRNHILMKSLTAEIAAQKPKYVVLVNEKGMALNIIKQLATHDIAIFMLLNNLNKQDLSLLTVKERSYLIGSVIPNNYSAGKKLIDGLLALYFSKNKSAIAKVEKENALSVLALQGDYTTPASLDREQGLKGVLKANSNVSLIDSTVANWSKKQSFEKVTGILQHADINIIWAANDAMAFGAKKAVLAAKIDHPIYIGGINWDVDDSDYPVNISFGGHVALGAKSLVMLKDIDNNSLKMDSRHQALDIFESSLSPYYHDFTQRLNLKKLHGYDFSRFCQSSTQPLVFSIESLAEVFNSPMTN